jgi:hypothetical protein
MPPVGSVISLDFSVCQKFRSIHSVCTAKRQYRKLEIDIPRKGIPPPQSDFHIHVSVNCERFIYSKDRCAYSAAGKYVYRTWEYINRSKTKECGNWD